MKKRKIKFPKIKFVLSPKIKKFAVVLIVLLSVVALAFNFKSLLVAAVVNGKPISRLYLDRQLEKQGGKQILENEIVKILILDEAKNRKLEISLGEIDKKIQEIEGQVTTGGSSLDKLLEAQGQTRDSFKEQIKIQLIIEKVLSKDVSVTEEEIKDYYDKNKAFYAKDKKFEDLKGQINDDLARQKIGEKFQPWLDELKKKAKIYYFINL